MPLYKYIRYFSGFHTILIRAIDRDEADEIYYDGNYDTEDTEWTDSWLEEVTIVPETDPNNIEYHLQQEE